MTSAGPPHEKKVTGLVAAVGSRASGSRRVTLVLSVLAMSFGGALACGRTGLELLDDVGNDGVASGYEAGEARGADAAPDALPGSGSLPPSCAPGGPGMTNCGPGGSGGESCCASLEVPGGTYYRTYSNSGNGPTGEANPATVSGFRLDKYLVTVGRFRQFVDAVMPSDAGPGGYAPEAGSGKHTYLNGGLGLANVGDEAFDGGDAGMPYEPGWIASDDSNVAPTNDNLACGLGLQTWTDSAASNETLPINCVNWWESYAFCIWDGGFLPSEAEWEYATAGGSQEREFPWGSASPAMSDLYAIYNNGYYDGYPLVAPVGTATLGAARWGQLDMVGELWEWNLDATKTYVQYVDPCINCSYLPPPPPFDLVYSRVANGYYVPYTESQASPGAPYCPDSYPPSTRLNVGFRCARAP
jgi:sulfatase modifying factor 1